MPRHPHQDTCVYVLAYTKDDDGTWILCETHNQLSVNLGYFPRVDDVVKAVEEIKHA